MVAQIFTRPAPGWLREGHRIYAIGDVHGCDERLAQLHEMIAADVIRAPPEQATVVHLGDYIDRGPQSAGVVRRLMATAEIAGAPVVNLRGNHEQMMLDALTGSRQQARHWLSNGGDATLRSWGISSSRSPETWLDGLSEEEAAFLGALPLLHRVDGYVFVHAGLRPGVGLERQAAEDMLWIRGGFLDHYGLMLPEAPDVAVVHGHTPGPAPEIVGRRIGIDTGAVMGGPLTCAVLEDRTVRFLTN